MIKFRDIFLFFVSVTVSVSFQFRKGSYHAAVATCTMLQLLQGNYNDLAKVCGSRFGADLNTNLNTKGPKNNKI